MEKSHVIQILHTIRAKLCIICISFPPIIPGNMVVDSLMESYFNLPYDSDGQIVSLVWMTVQSLVL